MGKQTVKIGDQFTTKYGPCIVVDYKNCENVFVKFLNTGGITKTNTTDLRRDQVKDYFYPIIEGKGYFGQGEYKARINKKITEEYAIWCSMLKRCYDPKILEKEPSYIGCEVIDDWLNYQVFAEWMTSQNYRECGWQLDKDLLYPGNKLYCPDKCIFLPATINKALAIHKESLKKELPIGVREHRNSYVVCMNKYGKNTYLGSFKTIEEAQNVYREEKLKYLYELGKSEKCPKFIMDKFENFIYYN